MPPQLEKVDSVISPDQKDEALPTAPDRTEPLSTTVRDNPADLEFHDLPPFPNDVSAAPLLRISLSKLLSGAQDEVDRLWKASCELGFFYLDLRDGEQRSGLKSPEQEELWSNVWEENAGTEAPTEQNGSEIKPTTGTGTLKGDIKVSGEQLLRDAEALFRVGEELFELPAEEKVKYDLSSRGSYFGYKGYGGAVIDAQGTRDRNEFYNVSKDDILEISEPLPAPEFLDIHRGLLKSYIKHSHAIVSLLLRLLNARLDLPPDRLSSMHRLHAVSGDQVRWVHAPPQPFDDRRTALGEHTDFGSITILFNRLGGLQVLPPQGDWCYVKPLKGHAVVNLGDAMVKFTGGILRSNIHRVVNPPGEQADSTRMSLVYFARPEDDVLLKVLDDSALIRDKRKETVEWKGEEDVTAKEWILRRALGARGQAGDWKKSRGTETVR
ncbi:hypothetical protein MBLNU459_g2224t1 [Dothideomycetes sp. NU459]